MPLHFLHLKPPHVRILAGCLRFFFAAPPSIPPALIYHDIMPLQNSNLRVPWNLSDTMLTYMGTTYIIDHTYVTLSTVLCMRVLPRGSLI